ncbi:MAG: hypothetical protein HC834_06255 [Rhodospirillales bacterium]|nr:hypothetical protein [Rhodospirillales bacterium]
MTFQAAVQHFQTLVTSFHPVIVMETVEEERVQALIKAACRDLQMAVFEWSIAQGLMRSPDCDQNRWQNDYVPPGEKRGQPLPKTADPLDMLRHIQDIVEKHAELLIQRTEAAKRHQRLCELNVIEQVQNVAQTTIVQQAWERGQELVIHGWIYGIHNGLLRDLGVQMGDRQGMKDAFHNALANLSQAG